MNELGKIGIIPVNYATLSSLLTKYESVKDKVSSMEQKGDIIRLKKGLYVVSNILSNTPISKELIANHLYSPSYISLESALSVYGLIPERVIAIRSLTFKRSKTFTNKLGLFTYTQVPKAYFEIGIQYNMINNQFAYLIAAPEKAICDMIIATPMLRIQSVKAMQNYLEDDLRLDFSSLSSFDTSVVMECLKYGKNKVSLSNLLKYMQRANCI